MGYDVDLYYIISKDGDIYIYMRIYIYIMGIQLDVSWDIHGI